jgi:hypothetical protein
MPPRKLARLEPTDDWPYLQLQFEWPEQEDYEVVRPVVLFGFTPAERAQQTGLSACTIYRKATRFESPQLPLLELDPDGWRLALELPHPRRGRRLVGDLIQTPLFALSDE